MSTSESDPEFGPVLGSLWVSDDIDLDEPRIHQPNSSDFQQDETTNADIPVSPSHSQDMFLGWQEHSPRSGSIQDWGVLDDLIYDHILSQEAGGINDQQRTSNNTETIPLKTTPPGAETNIQSGLHSAVCSSWDILNSAVPSPLPELRSFGNFSIGSPDPLWTRSNTTLSRPGSISSVQTERRRSRRKEASQMHRLHSVNISPFQEHVFHSILGRSTSRASASSGRRGPLDAEARATMSAVKEVGACWRCSTLKKPVSSQISLFNISQALK
jgi:hypothetical protein